MDVAEGTWSGGARSRGFVVGAVVMVVGGVGLLFVEPVIGGLLLFLAVVFVAFARVSVTIDGSGVRVRSGTIPWPSVTIRLDRIESAEAVDIRPMQWGGWGYRGSLKVFRRAGWILRAGPGLKLGLAGGRTFAVTVDDAAEAAEVLDGLCC